MTSQVLDNEKAVSKERLYVFLLAAIQFTHIVDFVVMMPLGPTLMRVMDISPIQFASLVSSYNFSAAIAGVLYGIIADRFGRKKLLIACFIGFILGTLACGLTHEFEFLLLARIIAGAFGGVLNGIVFAITADLIPFHRRGAAMGVIMSSFSIASIIGVPIGLAISDSFGWQKTFWFIAAFGVPVAVASHFVFPNLKDHIKNKTPIEDLKRFGILLLNMKYLKAYFLIFLMALSSFSIIPFLSPYAVKNVGLAETDLKYIYLVGGLFTVVTSRLVGKASDRFGSFQVFSSLALFSFLPIYLYTTAPPMGLTLFLALSAFFMTVVSGRFIPVMTLASEVPESEDRGTFMGLLNSIRSLGSASATLVGGAIIIETQSGKLERFDMVGFFSMAVSLLAIGVSGVVWKIVKTKRIKDQKEAVI